MTENEIKEMLKDIIDNGAEYEFTYKDRNGDYCPWKKYKLGYSISPNYEYRKVEKWCVYKQFNIYKIEKQYLTDDWEEVFSGTKEECEKWIEKHTKKTWLEEEIKKSVLIKGEDIRVVANVVCKKILEEMDKTSKERYIRNENFPFNFEKRDIEHIIFHLGVEL